MLCSKTSLWEFEEIASFTALPVVWDLMEKDIERKKLWNTLQYAKISIMTLCWIVKNFWYVSASMSFLAGIMISDISGAVGLVSIKFQKCRNITKPYKKRFTFYVCLFSQALISNLRKFKSSSLWDLINKRKYRKKSKKKRCFSKFFNTGNFFQSFLIYISISVNPEVW